MSAAFNFENNVEGGQNQINQGQNVEATQNVGDANEPTIEKFIGVVAESVPNTEEAKVLKERLHTFQSLPAEAQTEQIKTGGADWMPIVETVSTNAGTIWKNIATFGAAALKTFAEKQPIVAGIVAVCEANRSA